MIRNGTRNVIRKVLTMKPIRNVSTHMNRQQVFQATAFDNSAVMVPLGMATFLGATMYFMYPKKEFGEEYIGPHDMMGRKNGFGTMLSTEGVSKGEIYEGEFLHGKKHGHGILDFPTGQRMEGIGSIPNVFPLCC
jgi:hypothetical protein